MRRNRTGLLLALGLVVGCQDPGTNPTIQRLQSENAELKRLLAELNRKCDSLSASTDSLNAARVEAANQIAALDAKAEAERQLIASQSPRLSDIESKWKRFEESERLVAEQLSRLVDVEMKWNKFDESYEPSTRQALEENSKAAVQLLDELKKSKASTEQTLASLVQTAEECRRLKEVCSQHAKEANDANLLGGLKSAVNKLEESVKNFAQIGAKVQKIQSDVTSVASKVGKVETQVTSVQSKVGTVESKIGSVEFKVRSVESDVRSLRSRVR